MAYARELGARERNLRRQAQDSQAGRQSIGVYEARGIQKVFHQQVQDAKRVRQEAALERKRVSELN